MKYFSLLLCILLLSSCTKVPKPEPSTNSTYEEIDIPSTLQGLWISTEDPQAAVLFEESQKIDVYEGKRRTNDSFFLSREVLDPDSSKQSPAQMIVQKEDGTETYSIVSLSPSLLELQHLPRGNMLIYVRAPGK